MTGKFSDPDPARCAHYARFMSKISVLQVNLIFWFLFCLVLVLMCIASWQHHKSNALTELYKNLPPSTTSSTKHKLKIRRKRLTYLGYASLCFVVSIAATIFECFALFNIQFCDGEDLTQLYWGFWSVLQLGSDIAILGVMVQFWIVIGDIETPSWAVALGTPVLVFAALGFVIRDMALSTFTRSKKNQPPTNEDIDIEARRGSDNTMCIIGTNPNDSNYEIDSEKYANRDNADRRMSNAPTVAPPLTPHLHHALSTSSTSTVPSQKPLPPQHPLGPARQVQRPVEEVSVRRHSTFWQRDLRNMLNSVLSNPPREDN